MKTLICAILLASAAIHHASVYNGSTSAAVTLVGGVIKATHTNIDKKYQRKDCPVCKGKGYYISGDGISKVECGYCEPETKQEPGLSQEQQPECKDGTCPTPQTKPKTITQPAPRRLIFRR